MPFKPSTATSLSCSCLNLSAHQNNANRTIKKTSSVVKFFSELQIKIQFFNGYG
jgi:hypothetical protein